MKKNPKWGHKIAPPPPTHTLCNALRIGSGRHYRRATHTWRQPPAYRSRTRAIRYICPPMSHCFCCPTTNENPSLHSPAKQQQEHNKEQAAHRSSACSTVLETAMNSSKKHITTEYKWVLGLIMAMAVMFARVTQPRPQLSISQGSPQFWPEDQEFVLCNFTFAITSKRGC